MTQDDILTPKPPHPPDQLVQCCLQSCLLGKYSSSTTSLRKHWHILSTDPQLENTFKEPLWVVFRCTPNISQRVVRFDLPPVPRSTFLDNGPDGNYRCCRCTQCNFTKKAQRSITPSRASVLSGLCYVGKTKQALKTRIADHRSNIRTLDLRNPVAAHFMEARHNISSLKDIGIEY
ncbi:unnamed protein product, partial [Coregonus sp. 'balchen']